MAGAMGSFDSDIQQYLSTFPGIASALKSGQGSGRGIVSLVQLPAMLAKEPVEAIGDKCASNVGYPNSIEKQSADGYAIYKESRLDSEVLDPSLLQHTHEQGLRESLRQVRFPKTGSYRSLPAKLDADDRTNQNKQKLGNRSMTRPELRTPAEKPRREALSCQSYEARTGN